MQFALDRVILMPTYTPPHKAIDDEPGVAHRLQLCAEAVAGDERRLEVSSLEAERRGTSFTVDTLEELHARAPDTQLHLILGGDIAAGLPEWHEPERVLSLATVAVAERTGTQRGQVQAALAGLRGGERARFFAMPTIEVSSTMVRERVRTEKPIRYLVPDRVWRYIDAHRLYRPPEDQ